MPHSNGYCLIAINQAATIGPCGPRPRRLAIEMSTGEAEMRAEIELDDAVSILEKDFRRSGGKEQRRLAARRFLEEEQVKSGVIIQSGSKVRFWHLTFREALAAQGLAEDRLWRVPLLEKGMLYDGRWRETVLLLAGELKSQGGDEKPDELLEEMLNRAETPSADLTERARCVGLMGLLLKDLDAWQYSMTEQLAARYNALLAEVEAIFDAAKAYDIPFSVRLDAANALGLAGDRRLDRDNFVRLEGGTFIMGAQKDNPNGPNYDEEAYEDESPVREESVGPFLMGRYLVTVAEYERFIESRGYEIQDYWSAGGFGKFTEPDEWASQLEEPKNRPVTGVSWFEASAYCNWNKGRLPKEKEWEFAARAGRSGVRYPWDDEEPSERRANYGYEDSPNAPTPVGLYPAGATPNGLLDMAGNVWEWVEDQYQDEAETSVLRGGGWYDNAWVLRVSYRYWFNRIGRDDDIGFRCVREVVSL